MLPYLSKNIFTFTHQSNFKLVLSTVVAIYQPDIN